MTTRVTLYNPGNCHKWTQLLFQKDHGNPGSTERHVGDLGNVLTHSERYSTNVFIYDRLITLQEGADNSITGRAVVVHAGIDDLGEGGDAESKKTGNAGARVTCGVIERHDEDLPRG